MKRNIGETFVIGGNTYKVVSNPDNTCAGCDFFSSCCARIIDIRGDCNCVIFKKIDKDMKKDFKKKDLESGMVVMSNSGTYYLVVGNALVDTIGYLNLDDYDDNLRFEDGISGSRCFDIKEVYEKKSTSWGFGFAKSLTRGLTLIWKREDIQEFTLKEIADKLGIPVDKIRIKD